MSKFKKNNYNVSSRIIRYLERTIKKNNQEIFNNYKNIKSLNETLKNMTNYAISSYNYNNYLVNFINNSTQNVESNVESNVE